MDNLMRVSGILSKCLTTEAFRRFCPSGEKGNGGKVFGAKEGRNNIFVKLLEYAGEIVTGELKRELVPEEVILVYNRVEQFLIARGVE